MNRKNYEQGEQVSRCECMRPGVGETRLWNPCEVATPPSERILSVQPSFPPPPESRLTHDEVQARAESKLMQLRVIPGGREGARRRDTLEVSFVRSPASFQLRVGPSKSQVVLFAPARRRLSRVPESTEAELMANNHPPISQNSPLQPSAHAAPHSAPTSPPPTPRRRGPKPDSFEYALISGIAGGIAGQSPPPLPTRRGLRPAPR